jgi:3-hydroxyacyl-CoA dehydrogenase/enoyl-CoA hydratase/3-hydroxybutyryl-CoA epimerase/enoyl-CoA isomerase
MNHIILSETTMYHGTTLRLDLIEPHVAELCFDRRDGSVNKLDWMTFGELSNAITAIRAASHLEGLLVSSARDGFIVGADIYEFAALFALGEDALAARILGCTAIFTALEDLPLPIVSAINGVALGGGFELALATDYRVMADTARVGLPEVGLGIIPGYGGTVRLPRIAGMARALDWIVSGTQRRADAARDAGAVDLVVPQDRVRDVALALLREAIAGREDWRARRRRHHRPVVADPAALEAARLATARQAAHYPAASAAVELMAQSAPASRDAALTLESQAFAAIAKSQAAASLVGLFINDQLLKKKAKYDSAHGRPVSKVAILGAGIMGGGIAYQSALRGTPVIMKDIAQHALDIGLAEAGKLLGKQVAAGRLTQAKADLVKKTITPQLHYDGVDQADLVIEAVVEDQAIKQAVLAEVERHCGPDAVLASNTSSLSITALARGLRRPHNFVGMHFFNPVPAMALVEVIRGPQTSGEAVATTVAYTAAMGKTPIVVQDCPGFLVNRILTAYLLGFAGLIRDGADFEQVDAALEAFGWPMGPAYLQDVIGMDTARHVVEIIAAGYPDRMSAADNPGSLLADAGRLGQKNGLGFYRYETDSKGKPRKLAAADTHALLARLQPGGPRTFGAAEIIDRTMLPMLIEAALCLENGVVDSAAELDMALILGLGFPRYLGGPLRYADFLGMHTVVNRCAIYADHGALYRPTARMIEMAAAGHTYFA